VPVSAGAAPAKVAGSSLSTSVQSLQLHSLYRVYALRVHQSLYKPVLRPLVPDGASGSTLD